MGDPSAHAGIVLPEIIAAPFSDGSMTIWLSLWPKLQVSVSRKSFSICNPRVARAILSIYISN